MRDTVSRETYLCEKLTELAAPWLPTDGMVQPTHWE